MCFSRVNLRSSAVFDRAGFELAKFYCIFQKSLWDYFFLGVRVQFWAVGKGRSLYAGERVQTWLDVQCITFERTNVQKRATIHFRELRKSFPKLTCNVRFDDEKPLYKRKKTDAHLAWLEIGFSHYKNLKVLQGITFERTDVQKRATIHFRELRKSFPELPCNVRFDDEQPASSRSTNERRRTHI